MCLSVAKNIKVGFEFLPGEIRSFLESKVSTRVSRPDVFHVTEIVGCLRAAYFYRVNPGHPRFDIKGMWNIFRGSEFDRIFTSLFEFNQVNAVAVKGSLSLSGTFDFMMYDKELGENVIVDLKMPANLSYKKSDGVGRSYRLQIQAYIALNKHRKRVLDVRRGRVLMIADDVLYEEFLEWPEILEAFFWPRANLLNVALLLKDPSILPLAVEDWRCDYCGVSEGFCELCHGIRNSPKKLNLPVFPDEPGPEKTKCEKEMEGLLY